MVMFVEFSPEGQDLVTEHSEMHAIQTSVALPVLACKVWPRGKVALVLLTGACCRNCRNLR